LQPQQEASGADSDDDWSMGAKKGKKGKAAAAGKGKGGKAGGSSNAAGGKQQQKGGPDVNSVLSVGVLAQEVLKLYPDMEGAGELGWLCVQCLAPRACAASCLAPELALLECRGMDSGSRNAPTKCQFCQKPPV
jgi:hypothetical protein